MSSSRTLPRWRPRPTPFLAAAIWLVSMALYMRTLAPSILPADSGEFQFASYVLGLVHPTGYPLYLLLGRLFALLPFGDVAYRLNLMSAFWGASAVCVVYLLGLEIWGSALTLTFSQREREFRSSPWKREGRGEGWIAAHLAALAAAGLFAVSDTFWSQAVIAEVYTLNAFFAALALLLLLQWARGRRSLLPLAFVFGLSLTHHRTMVLLVPAFLAFWLTVVGPSFVKARRRSASKGAGFMPAARSGAGSAGTEPTVAADLGHVRMKPAATLPGASAVKAATGPSRRLLLTMVLLVLAPLLLYLYIPLRAPAASYLRVHVGERELVLYHNDLSGFWDMVSGRVFAGKLKAGEEAHLDQRWQMFAELLQRQFTPVGIAAGVLGAFWLLLRRWRVALLLLLCFGTVVAFGLAYTIGDVYVMFIPAYLVFSLFDGAAILAGSSALRRFPLGGVCQLTAPALALALVAYLAMTNFPRNDRSGQWQYRQHWDQVVAQPLERGALLATDDRDDIIPLWYLQQVEGRRRDLVGIFPGMIEAEEFSDVARVVDQFVGTGQAIYLIKPMPGLEIKYQLVPAGLLTKIVGPAFPGAPQVSANVDYADHLLLTGYDFAGLPGSEGQVGERGAKIKITLCWQVLQSMTENYTTFIHIADPSGKVVAQSDHQPGGVFYPSSRWRTGEIIADQHEFTLPAGAAPGTYEIRAGVYYLPTMRRLPIVPAGDIATIGQFTVGE